MRKLILSVFALFIALAINAQTNYYTMYSFEVKPENEATVVKLISDYYSNNKPDGVFVRLFENHFQDASKKATHHIIFSGSQEAVGNMYSGGDEKFALFITRLNQHIKAGAGSGMGRHISLHIDEGEGQRYYAQRIYFIHAKDTEAFDKGWDEFHSKHRPDGTLALLASPIAGEGWGEYNRIIVSGFKDMKSAIGGQNSLISGNALKARQDAWQEYRATNGGVELKGNAVRVLLGAW
jgi:hypothetical protein